MNWAKDAYKTGYQFNPRTVNYKSQIKKIEKHNNYDSLRPEMKSISLPPDNLTLDVTCYDFSSMLSSLLSNEELNQFCNLVVDPVDHFAKYVSPSGNLGEVNSGHWYQQAYSNLIIDVNNDFLMPIIFAMDKTTISTTSSLHVFVIMFTTSIFKRSIRNQAHAWRPLGYIPIDRNYYSGSQWQAMSSEIKSVRLNMLFDIVLQSFRIAQRPGALKVPLTLGDQTKVVNLKVPLAFIIGDIQGGDNICGRSAYYQSDARRICRMCNATPDVYNSKEVENCQLLVMEEMKKLCIEKDTKALYKLMQYKNWQAFYDIDYGGLPGGVFTAACPPEALHSLENGLINHCLQQLFNHMITNTAQRKFDMVVQKWSTNPKQYFMRAYARDFPRLLFSDGVSSITDISAGTKVGILFAIVIASLTTSGRNILLNESKLTSRTYLNMIEAFELLLCYWAWLKKDEFWNINDLDALQCAKASIFRTIERLKHLFPRSVGNQWKIPKLHEQLHIAQNIYLFGSHQNVHTGPQEHNHIANTKKPSQHTQKRKRNFDWQIANRLNDGYTVASIDNKISQQQTKHQVNKKSIESDSYNVIKKESNLASKFYMTIKRNLTTNQIDIKYQWSTMSLKKEELSQNLVNLLLIHFLIAYPISNKGKE